LLRVIRGITDDLAEDTGVLGPFVDEVVHRQLPVEAAPVVTAGQFEGPKNVFLNF
jgi:hypothetical protein